MRLAGLRGPWDTPGASTGRPTSRLENRSSCSLRSHDCGSLGLPRTPSLAVLRFAEALRTGLRGLCHRRPRRSVTRSCASSVAFASSSKPPSYPGRSPAVVNHRSSPAASPGIRRYAPPSTSFRFRARQRCRRRDVSGCHSRDRAAHVVFHHLSGLPSPKVAGVLQPAADPGVRRVSVRAALPPGRIRWPRATPSPRRTSYPSKNPLAGSRTASPRPLHLLRFHRPPGTLRPLSQPDGDTGRPRRSDGLWPTDCSADLHTSTWGLHDDRSHREFPQASIGPPGAAASRFPHPCGQENRNPARPGEWAASGPCSTDEFVPCAPDWIPETTPARFFLGFVPLQGPSTSPLRARPTPPPPKREGASSSDPSSCRRVPCTL
jgi:hypothetical protein